MLVEDADAQVVRLLELRARLGASDDEISLAADRAGHAAADGHDCALGVAAAHAVECAGQHEALVAQRAAARGLGGRLDLEKLFQAAHGVEISWLVEILAHAARDLGTDIAHRAQVIFARGAEFFE